MNQTFGPNRTDPSNAIFMPRGAGLDRQAGRNPFVARPSTECLQPSSKHSGRCEARRGPRVGAPLDGTSGRPRRPRVAAMPLMRKPDSVVRSAALHRHDQVDQTNALTSAFAQKEAPVRTRRHARNRRAAEAGIRRRFVLFCGWRSERGSTVPVSQPNDYGTRASRALSAKFCSVRPQTPARPSARICVADKLVCALVGARPGAIGERQVDDGHHLALADRSACLAGTRFLRRSHQWPAAYRRATAAAAQSIAPR
jgi:hypothetical protein